MSPKQRPGSSAAHPTTVQIVEVHDGEQCSCAAQYIGCPLLDHRALIYQKLQSQQFQIQPWCQQVRMFLHDAPRIISHNARWEALDNLVEEVLLHNLGERPLFVPTMFAAAT